MEQGCGVVSCTTFSYWGACWSKSLPLIWYHLYVREDCYFRFFIELFHFFSRHLVVGSRYDFLFRFIKNWKRQLWVRPIEWLKLNFASCVVHQTRSLDVLMLYLIIIWCLCTKPTVWLILSFTNFTEGRSRVFYILSSWRISVGDSPGCCQGQQDDFPQPFCALILYNPHRG